MKIEVKILLSLIVCSIVGFIYFYPNPTRADDNPISSIHIESSNPFDSTVARAGDVIRITYTQNPNYDGFNGIYSLGATMLFNPNGGDFNNGWGAEDTLTSCNYADLGTTKNVCVYDFPVSEIGDATFFYNPQEGLFQFAANTNYGLFIGSTDGSTVTIDRSKPTTTISSPANNAQVGTTFSITGTCTNGLSVNFSGTGFTPSTASVACTGGVYTSPTFTVVGNPNVTVKQTTAAGNTTTVTRRLLAPAPSFESTKTWNFSTAADYTYDNTKITVSSGTAQFQKPNTSEGAYWAKDVDNPFLSPTQAWEETLVFEPSVIYEDGIYKMWYSGGGALCAVGYATSPDGKNWTKPFNHPIVGQGYGGMPGIACRNNVIKHDGVYYLTVVDGTGSGGEEVWLLTSTDGINFTNPRIILRTSNPDLGIANTYVFIDDDGTWYLFYDYKTESSFIWELNFASGPDLDHLARHFPNPNRTLYRNGMYGGMTIKKIGKQYHMWYHASTNGQPVPTKIYHSVSDDLIHWRNLPDVVVEISQSWWETDQTADPFIIEVNGKTYIYYDGDDNTQPSNVIAYVGRVEFDGTLDDFGAIQTQSITPVISQQQVFSSLWGFTETATKGSNTATHYQVSIDGGTTWKYWNGSLWVSAGALDGSTALEINDNIRTLDALGNGGTFTYKALMYSEGNSVSLDTVALSYSYISAPTGLQAQAASTTSASLSWSAPTSGALSVTDYTIEYRVAGANSWNVFSHTASTLTNNTVTGLTPGTQYEFRVSAVNAETASNASSIASVVLPSPPQSGGASVVFLPSWTQPLVQTAHTPVETVCKPLITTPIRQDARNNEETVKTLQKFLNDNQGERLALDGTYDADDFLAVKRFQEKYQTEILAPWGLTKGTGIVSVTTLAKINALNCGQTLGCPYFTEYVKGGEVKTEVSKIKAFLNTLDATLKLDVTSTAADASFVSAVSKFQLRYKDFILKPWGLSKATGYWYKTTSAKANEFMGCKV